MKGVAFEYCETMLQHRTTEQQRCSNNSDVPLSKNNKREEAHYLSVFLVFSVVAVDSAETVASFVALAPL